MNRQRRLEAIARRRALIDSQLHLFSAASTHEIRVPNIIRSRAAGSQARQQNLRTVNHGTLPLPASSGRLGTLNAEESIMAGRFSSGGGGSTTDMIPIPVEISEKIASIIARNDGDVLKSFQTIKTEDGTVMIVLEGDGSGDCISSFVEEEGQVQEGIVEEETSFTVVDDAVPQPEAVDVKVEPQFEDIHKVQEEGESYVIVKSESGNDILVPSSTYYQMQQRNTSEEQIVNYIASEGGVIEEQMSRNSDSPVQKLVPIRPAKKVKSVLPKGKVSSSPFQAGGNISRGSESSLVLKQPRTTTTTGFRAQDGTSIGNIHPLKTNGQTDPRGSKPKLSNPSSEEKEEKPRPFRFEMPELELEEQFNDLNDGFMTVPVPIKIDSLRSETSPASSSSSSSSIFQKKVPAATMKAANKDTLSCVRCPETFPRVLDLLDHVKKRHGQANAQTESESPSFTSTVSNDGTTVIASLNLEEDGVRVKTDEATCTTSHSVQPIACVFQEENLEGQDQFLSPVAADEGGTLYFQIIDFDGEGGESVKRLKVEQHQAQCTLNPTVVLQLMPTSDQEDLEVKQAAVESGNTESVTFYAENEVLTVQPTGRRTLTKTTAKANMSNELDDNCTVVPAESFSFSPEFEFSEASVKNNTVNYDGDMLSVQSARIRARNDRVKAMDGNNRKEEELSVNFKTIFQQVAKHGTSFV